MDKKETNLLIKQNKDLMKENKELRRTIDKKDSTIGMYMDINVEKNKELDSLKKGVEYSKSKSAGVLSVLGKISKKEQPVESKITT